MPKNLSGTIRSKLRLFTRLMGAMPVLLILILAAMLAACGRQPTPEEQIREFIFTNQPTTPEEFVQWANANLTDYSNRQIFRAIHNEGSRQAELGHPNAVGVLSQAALAWADKKNLRYSPTEWIGIQKTAISNLRQGPAGDPQLWPAE